MINVSDLLVCHEKEMEPYVPIGIKKIGELNEHV